MILHACLEPKIYRNSFSTCTSRKKIVYILTYEITLMGTIVDVVFAKLLQENGNINLSCVRP